MDGIGHARTVLLEAVFCGAVDAESAFWISPTKHHRRELDLPCIQRLCHRKFDKLNGC